MVQSVGAELERAQGVGGRSRVGTILVVVVVPFGLVSSVTSASSNRPRMSLSV
jgi:hypothetical protein